MFEKTKKFVVKNERKLWASGVLGVVIVASYYKLVSSNQAMDYRYVVLAIDEMNLTGDILKKITEIIMREDF